MDPKVKEAKMMKVTIGKKCQLNGTLDLNRPHTIIIRDKVVLGGGSRVITHCPIRSFLPDDRIIIGDCAWIGYRSVILPGVRIGRFAIIGTQSVVSKDIPPYHIAAGNPIRILRKRDKDEIRRWYIQKWKLGKEPNKDVKYDPNMLTEEEEKWIFKDYD
jgi:acetyltransferase-like isoleucine patch superfamily enzyme